MTEERKVIYVEYNGYEWWFPAKYVARSWAEYYSKLNGTTVEEEYNVIMNDDEDSHSVLVNWFVGDMNWSDVSKYAKLSKQPFEVAPNIIESDIRVSYREW